MVGGLGFGVGDHSRRVGMIPDWRYWFCFVFLSLQKSPIEKPLPGHPHRASIEEITSNE
jgi:hypothetical protein